MSFHIGMVTIGQSPREDIITEIRKFLSDKVGILEAGALDELTAEEIRLLSPTSSDDTLVTRLRNGQEVIVSKKAVLPLLKTRILSLGKADVDIIAMLCSGEFADCSKDKPMLLPSALIQGVLKALLFRGSLGVLVPSERQVEASQYRYNSMGFQTIVKAVSPYTQQYLIRRVASELAGKVDVILMDCFGYSMTMKEEVQEVFDGLVVQARSLLAHVLAEFSTEVV